MKAIGFVEYSQTKTTEADREKRRVDGIRFLAATNPDKYAAKYVDGRLELYRNVWHGCRMRGEKMYAWLHTKT